MCLQSTWLAESSMILYKLSPTHFKIFRTSICPGINRGIENMTASWNITMDLNVKSNNSDIKSFQFLSLHKRFSAIVTRFGYSLKTLSSFQWFVSINLLWIKVNLHGIIFCRVFVPNRSKQLYENMKDKAIYHRTRTTQKWKMAIVKRRTCSLPVILRMLIVTTRFIFISPYTTFRSTNL